ncbi:MAG: VPLPA-CTERM sorting domain-containing protein [Pseudomonadota bacterium]
MARVLAAGIVASMITGGAALAANADFGLFNEGDIVSDFGFTDLGNGIIANVTATGGTDQAVILDTLVSQPAHPVGDPDLESPFTNPSDGNAQASFGNALLVQEDNNQAGTPNDNVGGTILFEFAGIVDLTELVFLDGEANETITITTNKGGLVVSAGQGDNTFTPIVFGGDEFKAISSLTVDISGSGAIGEFHATVVPLPASVLLLLGGLGVFGWIGRRRMATA